METKVMSKSTKDDLELVRVMQTGNKREVAYACNKIFDKYCKLIEHTYRKKTNSQDVAQDVALISLTKAMTKINSFDGSTAFSTWIFSIAKNTFIDYLRTRRVEYTYVDDLVSMATEQNDSEHTTDDVIIKGIIEQSSELNVEELLIKAELHKKINNAVDKCIKNKSMKQLINLRYFQELSYEEISDELKIPIGTVKGQLFKAREILKQGFIREKVLA